MNKEYIIRRVKAKINLKQKLKDLKKKILKKKYKTLNEENAIAYAKDLGKEHYWGFDVKDNPKTTKRNFQDVPIIDVAIENSKENIGDTVSIWFDPVLKTLHGDYKKHMSRASYKPEFRFKPLTEENAVDYTNSLKKMKVDTSRKITKTKEDGISMIHVPMTLLDDPKAKGFDLSVCYDPGWMGLYGEW